LATATELRQTIVSSRRDFRGSILSQSLQNSGWTKYRWK